MKSPASSGLWKLGTVVKWPSGSTFVFGVIVGIKSKNALVLVTTDKVVRSNSQFDSYLDKELTLKVGNVTFPSGMTQTVHKVPTSKLKKITQLKGVGLKGVTLTSLRLSGGD